MNFNRLLLKNIRSSLGRFLAIVAIVALGTGFLSGLLSSTPDMKDAANSYYNSSNVYDFYIRSTLGLEKKYLDEFLKQSYIKDGTIVYEVDELLKNNRNDERFESRITHVDFENIKVNKPQLMRGRFPVVKGEAFIAVPNWKSKSVRIGDTLKGENTTLRIVGMGRLPQFSSANGEPTNIGDGKIKAGIYVPMDKSDKNRSIYTAIYLVGKHSEDRFSESYKNYMREYTSAVDSISKEQLKERYHSIVSQANGKIEKARKDIDSKKSKTFEEIDKNRKNLESKLEMLQKAQLQIQEALQKTNTYLALANAGENAEDNVDRNLEDVNRALNAGLDIVKNSTDIAEYNLDNIKSTTEKLNRENQKLTEKYSNLMKKNLTELENYRKKYSSDISNDYPLLSEFNRELEDYVDKNPDRYPDSSIVNDYIDNQINRNLEKNMNRNIDSLLSSVSKVNEITSVFSDSINRSTDSAVSFFNRIFPVIQYNREQLEKTKSMLDEKENAINTGISKINSSMKLIDKSESTAEKSFKEAYRSLDQAKKEIRKIDKGNIFVFNFEKNASFSSFVKDVEKVGAVAKVFPIFFFLVAALVVSTTMTRIIEEERTQIGTLKAIGYSNRDIRGYYVKYGLIASVVGGIAGEITGFTFFPLAISKSYETMYYMPLEKITFRPLIGISVFIGSAAAIILTVLLSCNNELKEKPAYLLLPKAPAAGKKILLEKIPFLWKKVPFSKKVTLRNLFRYKKRFFMTTIGIAGSVALLITGFGVKDSIKDIGRLQFKEIYKYDIYINKLPKSGKSFSQILKDEPVREFLPVFQKDGDAYFKNKSSEVTLTSPSDIKTVEKFINLRDPHTKKHVDLKKDSVLISQKLAEDLGIEKNDTVDVKLSNGNTGQFKVTGIVENYIGNQIYVSPHLYKKAFGVNPKFNAAMGFVDKSNKNYMDRLNKNSDIEYSIDVTTILETFEKSIESLNSIILLIIISASILTVIVLYNLININICERKKELATIEVLGFYKREVFSYIFREIDILALIGILFGIPLGNILHKFVILKIESNGNMFGRHINLTSYIYSVLLIMIFVFIVNTFMKRVIRKIKMAEAMKSD